MDLVELLEKEGIKVLPREKLSKEVRRALEVREQFFDDGGYDFALYGGEDAVSVFYTVNLNPKVGEEIERKSFERVKKARDFDSVKAILSAAKGYKSIFGFGPSWAEDPRKATDESYLSTLILKMENALKNPVLSDLENEYGLKLVPVVSIEKNHWNSALDLSVSYSLAKDHLEYGPK